MAAFEHFCWAVMKAIENAAFISIGRATGFAGLAIFCAMFGFAFDLAFAARAGGVLCLIVAGILFAYGERAHVRPYKRTETWLLIPVEDRPPSAIAQQVIGQVLRDTYLWFARQAAIFAIVLFACGAVLQFFPAMSPRYSETISSRYATFPAQPPVSDANRREPFP